MPSSGTQSLHRSDLLVAPLGEGVLILVVAGVGWMLHQPLIFTSLGPTAYELVEESNHRSARTYNVIVGHVLALAAGHFALWVTHSYGAPKVASAGFVSSGRLWAVVIAVVLTTLVTLAARASQPASLSTTLLVSLGTMQTGRDAIAIIGAVLLIAIIGEPIRRKRASMMRKRTSS